MKVGFKHIRSVTLLLAGCLGILPAGAHVKRAEVYNACVPVVLGRTHNVVAECCIEHDGLAPARLDAVEVRLGGVPAAEVRTVRLLYTGTMSALLSRSTSYAMRDEFRRLGGGQRLYADPDYAVEQSAAAPGADGSLALRSGQQLVKGRNYFYVSVESDIERVEELSQPFTLEITGILVDGRRVGLSSSGDTTHRWGVAVRQHGDDGIYAYRIPGLVTTPAGTLLGVYDVRHRTSLDLQENIDIGLSRSTDGGRTWEPMRIIMDMGCWGGLPEAQNGIGDPSILVDDRTGEVFVVAAWTHGLGNDRAWTAVGDGYEPIETAQLMLASSRDDGRTWSEPRNLTRQIKQPHWNFTLQGPGRGITMRDGTLVFPIQYIDSTRVPNAGVMYSLDHGATWHTHGHARTNTTESQVAEVAPGVLMLNMRDNRRTGRAVCTTRDMGRTWVEHPSSGALREPVCMASLLHVPASENVLGRDLLLFSNPDTTKGRNHLTIKASLDGGDTWSAEHALLLDEEENWGYSCLSMIDSETVGILYEASTAQLLFQAVKLRDIVRGGTAPDIAFGVVLFYFASSSLPGWATKNWLPTLFADSLGVPMSAAGPISTFTIAFSSFLGVMIGGPLSDRWVKRNLRGRIYTSAIGLGLMVPALVLLGLGHGMYAAVGAGLCFGVGFGMFDTNNMPILCQFVPVRLRATAYGIMNMTGVFAGAACTEVLGRWADGGNLGLGFALLGGVIAVALFVQLSVLRPTTDNME